MLKSGFQAMSLRLCAAICCSLMLGCQGGAQTVAVAQDAAKTKDVAPGEVKNTEQKSSEVVKTEGATDAVLAGHSYHGEAFNQGARQASYLMGGTGNIHFAATTNNPQVQKFINQGLGQYYGFWYLESERSFRQAATLDPTCAIAYWGMALANKNNVKRAKGFLEKANKYKASASKREQMYIDALNAYEKETDKKKDKGRKVAYVDALKEISKQFPKDLEAKALMSLQLYLNRSRVKIKKYEDVSALYDEILKENPLHPVHHFRIHLWDYKDAKKALTDAATCGQSAPSIAHMWHMPGHIYSKLKRYHDAVWQQEASARVDHAHMMRDWVLPDQIHNFAHNNEWLCRNLNYIGKAQAAIDLAKNMTELPRHPKYNHLGRGGSARYGRTRLFEALYRFEMWGQMLEMTGSAFLEPTDVETEQVKRLRARGIALLHLNRAAEIKPIVADLTKRLAKVTKLRDKAAADADAKAKKEKKKAKDIKKAVDAAKRTFSTRVSVVEKALNELNGFAAIQKGDKEAGIKLIEKCRDIAKPRLALYYLAAGNKAKAQELVLAGTKSGVSQTQPLAIQAHVFYVSGKKKEAFDALKKLRSMSGEVDLTSPVFSRLAPIAKEMKLPVDWRKPYIEPKDVGTRPKHDDLGPFRWQPVDAPQWSLKNDKGQTVSLADYRGKPVIMIFYLGYGCVHCVEQLAAFHPMTKDFKKAGIELVGVATDSVKDLKEALKPAKAGDVFPFPLLSGSDMKSFKAYRAYDDFEKQPLHGTFLIDGQGKVRWQDVSYQPFMDAKFLLKEAQRLLKIKSTKVAKLGLGK